QCMFDQTIVGGERVMNRTKHRGMFRFMILLLVFMLFTPMVSQGQGDSPEPQRAVQMADAKINDRLMSEFDDKDKVRFIIKFKGTTNTEKAAENGIQKATDDNASASQERFLQRSSVVSALKTTARESQEHVLDYLEEKLAEGQAEDIHPYFIVNGVAVTATEEVLRHVASFTNVEKILPNEKRELYDSQNSSHEVNSDDDDIEWNVERIQVPEVWDTGIDGTGAV